MAHNLVANSDSPVPGQYVAWSCDTFFGIFLTSSFAAARVDNHEWTLANAVCPPNARYYNSRAIVAANGTEELANDAEAGIADCWTVNLIDRQIEVYRQPHGRSCQEKTVHGKSQAVSPLALPAAEITPARLFP
jgi:hypothetical protein